MKAFTLPADTASNTLGGDHKLYTGVFQVSIVTPSGKYRGAAGALADQIITRKANETPAAIEFELGSPLDLQGVKLPRRQVVAGTCLWAYRSGECGYAGGPVADYANNPTSDPTKDQCSRTMTGCKKRFGENGELPFGGFPGIARVPRL